MSTADGSQVFFSINCELVKVVQNERCQACSTLTHAEKCKCKFTTIAGAWMFESSYNPADLLSLTEKTKVHLQKVIGHKTTSIRHKTTSMPL